MLASPYSETLASQTEGTHFSNFHCYQLTLQFLNIPVEESKAIASGASHDLGGVFRVLVFYEDFFNAPEITLRSRLRFDCH